MEVTKKRWLLLAVGTAVMFFAGIIYGWSILKAPLQEEFAWSASQLAFNFTLTMCMFCIGGIVSGVSLARVNLQVLLTAAGALTFTGFFLAAGVQAESLVRLYLSYGLLAGLGIGIGYNAIISVINEWFPDKKGTCSGILMMSFGASALIFGNIANWLINSPVGWRTTFQILGTLTGGTLLLAAAFMRHLSEEDKLVIAGASVAGGETEADSGALARECQSNGTAASKTDYAPLEMVKRPVFLRFFLFLILACAVGNSTISIARDVAVFVGAAPGMAALLAGVLSLCNGCGRLLAGMLFDRLGCRVTMTVDGIITIIAPIVMLAAIASHSVVICGAGLCLTGLSYSFQPPVTSSVVASFYGTKHFSINYSIANLMMIPTSFVATIAGALYTGTGSYFAPFVLLLLFSIISFILNLSIRQA